MLFKPALATLALSHLALAVPATVVEERQGGCQDVHLFLARGTSEPYPGRQSKIVQAVCQGIGNCGYEDIMYPAGFSPSYCASVSAGINAGTSQITAYAARCPNSKLVLTGYSQASVASERAASDFVILHCIPADSFISIPGCQSCRGHPRRRRRVQLCRLHGANQHRPGPCHVAR